MKSDSTEVTDVVPEFVAALEDPAPAVRLEAARPLRVPGIGHGSETSCLGDGALDSRGIGDLSPGCAVLPEHESNGSERPRADTTRAIELEYSKRCFQAKLALISLELSDAERDAMIKSMLESPHLNERLAAADFLIQAGMRDMGVRALGDLAQSDDPGIRERARRLLLKYRRGDEDL